MRARVAFRAKRPMNYEMFRPIHARLLADPRVDVTLYGKSVTGSGTDMLDEAGALPARRRPNWMAKFSRPDVLFSADFLLATRHARASIQIFHGVSIKNYFLSERIHDYTHVFASGPYMIRRYVERGFFEQGDPRLLPVGMPKTDRLTDGSLDRAAFLQRAGLDPGLPTVLYAPSWGPESSLDRMGREMLACLARVAEGGDLQVLVKLHDNAFDPRYGTDDWRAILDAHTGRHFAAPVLYDVIPFMHASDLMITDISSVAFEWLQLDRPLVFMVFDGQLDRWEGKADLDTWGRRIGTECHAVETLAGIIADELGDAGRLGPVRRAARDDIYFNVGRSTGVAVAEFYRIAGLTPPPTHGSAPRA